MYVRKNKFLNVKTVVDNIKFDSKREARRFGELKMLERAGEISDLELQPKYWLEIDGKPILLKSEGFPNGRRASVKWDFRYRDKRGRIMLEDVKSSASRTEAYVLRKGVFECLHPDLTVKEI